MQPMNRIQENIVARQERRFLDWACSWMPSMVMSDHLTILSVVGAVMVLCGYAASHLDPRYLYVSIAGFVINWFGDSMDGSLARFRKVTRPRYGYFLDHSVDALCTLLMIGGMGLSSYIRLDVALFAVIGYLALCIHVFLKNHVTGTFQLTFVSLGPTELRLIFVALTLFMLAAGQSHIVHLPLSDCDIVLLITACVFLGLFLFSTTTMIVQLRAVEGNGRRSMAAMTEPLRASPMRQPAAEPAHDRLRNPKQSTAF